jgi:formin-binding protein 1
MAQVAAVSFGATIKDGYKPVDNWVANGISWLAEIKEFYEERAAIEKEYSTKLTALAKKYYDKKNKRSSNLTVGDNPAMTPGSLESASLTTWTTQLSTLEARANEHQRFGGDLISQVANPLAYTQQRLEDLRKSHSDYQTKLIKERDSSYAELKKHKTRYDSACQEVESKRKKTESSFDSSKGKAQNAYNQQLMEMNNVKNTYLIGINVTNKLKECYYHQYIPVLLDSLQDLNETRVTKLNNIWSVAAALEISTMKRSADHVTHLANEIPRNDPSLDSGMFCHHNTVQWQDPPDFVFEPSPVWLDSDAMAVDDTSKIFLRNILSKSKPLVSTLKSDCTAKQRELDNVKKARENIRAGKDKRDESDCLRSQFSVQEELHALERQRLTAEVETSTITSVVGDLSMYGKSHPFKSETFKIPTNCDFCGDRIWGLSAKGFNCTECGFTCHSKCQMKVPADCPGEQTKEERKKLKAERQATASAAVEAPQQPPTTNGSMPTLTRQDTMNSLASGYAASATRSVSGVVPRNSTLSTSQTVTTPTQEIQSPLSATAAAPPAAGGSRRNRVVAPPPAAYISAPPPDDTPSTGSRRGRMLYAYEKRDDGEVSIEEGKEVLIIEGDGKSHRMPGPVVFSFLTSSPYTDGGWTRILSPSGTEGVVPTAYLEELPPSISSNNNHSPRPASSRSESTASLASFSQQKKKGPAVAPRRGAKKVKYVEAMYAYNAQSELEFDMEEGERFILISMGTGDGWADVERVGDGGGRGSVPAAYIQEVS